MRLSATAEAPPAVATTLAGKEWGVAQTAAIDEARPAQSVCEHSDNDNAATQPPVASHSETATTSPATTTPATATAAPATTPSKAETSTAGALSDSGTRRTLANGVCAVQTMMALALSVGATALVGTAL